MKKVPFYANLPDDLHCFEASIRMMLKYFMQEKEYSWKEIEKLTGKKLGLWTWPNRAMVALAKMGFTVIGMQDSDIKEFAEKGEQFLIDRYGEAVAKEQIKHSDIPYEQKVADAYVRHVNHLNKIPRYEDISLYLSQGYLVVCNVNAKTLNGKKGFVGHVVVVFQCMPQAVMLHDPGLPPQKNRQVPRLLFEKAWAYPNQRAKNIIAFRL